MDKQEIKELLVRIKVFYPRFEAVEKDESQFRIHNAVIDNWHRSIGFLPLDDAMKILEGYMESEEGKRIPSVNVFLTQGKLRTGSSWCTAFLDRRRNVIRWQPDARTEAANIPVRWSERYGCYEDGEGRLWALPGEL